MLVGINYLKERSITLLCVLLLAQPVPAGIRIIPARWTKPDKGIPKAFENQTSLAILKQAVPDTALCIAGPDESSFIYFYFLHKKGVWIYGNRRSAKNSTFRIIPDHGFLYAGRPISLYS